MKLSITAAAAFVILGPSVIAAPTPQGDIPGRVIEFLNPPQADPAPPTVTVTPVIKRDDNSESIPGRKIKRQNIGERIGGFLNPPQPAPAPPQGGSATTVITLPASAAATNAVTQRSNTKAKRQADTQGQVIDLLNPPPSVPVITVVPAPSSGVGTSSKGRRQVEIPGRLIDLINPPQQQAPPATVPPPPPPAGGAPGDENRNGAGSSPAQGGVKRQAGTGQIIKDFLTVPGRDGAREKRQTAFGEALDDFFVPSGDGSKVKRQAGSGQIIKDFLTVPDRDGA
ncbi:unnamed protein product [Periconia digitata]|uniref:Uncharacterized protein n=1 Tax=Periconia digitata TaxID=1303443 RepID=A0A9W4UFQ9_9PLEO|nr:unnamed protein product [Periconia digitata]